MKLFAPFFFRISRFSPGYFIPIFEEIPFRKLYICPSTEWFHCSLKLICALKRFHVPKVLMGRNEYAALYSCEYCFIQ